MYPFFPNSFGDQRISVGRESQRSCSDQRFHLQKVKPRENVAVPEDGPQLCQNPSRFSDLWPRLLYSVAHQLNPTLSQTHPLPRQMSVLSGSSIHSAYSHLCTFAGTVCPANLPISSNSSTQTHHICRAQLNPISKVKVLQFFQPKLTAL